MIDINSLRDRDNMDVFSVSDLNNYIKNIFETNRTLASVTVRGEISNFTNHRSGHLYFSLKDADGQIRAVMFRSRAALLKFMPESGMKVIVHGSVTVFPRDGSYQIYVSSMQPDGIGALYLAYEQMKARLAEEGLFDEDHKFAIPGIPRRIGVITSPTGAAVRDIINVTGRRFPQAEVYIYPALVQGAGAEESLIKALDYLDRSNLCDVIIIGRGGGSIEDLWAFNSEKLARRIYAATTPVISAVGHETDFTICDFVSDMRAPTPSAAAELAVPDIREIRVTVDMLSDRSDRALTRVTEKSKERLVRITEGRTLGDFSSYIQLLSDRVAELMKDAASAYESVVAEKKLAFIANVSKLDALNPLSVMTRGYSVAQKDGKILSEISMVEIGDTITIRLRDGRIDAIAQSKTEEYR